MRKKLLKFLALSLAFVLCVPTAGAARRGEATAVAGGNAPTPPRRAHDTLQTEGMKVS